MKECEFCGAATVRGVCGPCIDRMRDGFHPCICLRCRDLYGEQVALTWVHQTQLQQETQNVITDMRAATNGVAIFATLVCSICKEISNEALSSRRLPSPGTSSSC